jgi:hypothetical protein
MPSATSGFSSNKPLEVGLFSKFHVMNKITKILVSAVAGSTLFFAITAFVIRDPQADYKMENPGIDDTIQLSEITTINSINGAFKSSLKIKQNPSDNSAKEFYGLEINISDNPAIDQILIGVTNNLISRIEIRNKSKLVESKEMGFMDKFTCGENHILAVEFYDQTNTKFPGKSNIAMHFYKGTGFFGDIGTINMDLTKYGDLSGNKSVGVLAKSLSSSTISMPEFSNLKIWKNFKSFD